MTYAAFETSTQQGSPVEIYDFYQGAASWHYTTGVDGFNYNNIWYEPAPLTRNRIKVGEDVNQEGVKLTFPITNTFANQFIGFAPERVTTVTILRGHQEDPDAEFVVQWKGRIVAASVSQNDVDLECESVFTSVRRPGLRAKFEITCRHVLYGQGCGVAKEDYRVNDAVRSITSGRYLTTTDSINAADGYYTGGILALPNGDSRFIVAHALDSLTLSRPMHGLAVDDQVALYPGCDHLESTCNDKFNNGRRYGGCPDMTPRNPFDGSSIV